MNITLSADEKLIANARAYAKRHSTSLNKLIRDYLKALVNEQTNDEAASEFISLALNQGGTTPEGYRFDRNALYNRRDQIGESDIDRHGR